MNLHLLTPLMEIIQIYAPIFSNWIATHPVSQRVSESVVGEKVRMTLNEWAPHGPRQLTC